MPESLTESVLFHDHDLIKTDLSPKVETLIMFIYGGCVPKPNQKPDESPRFGIHGTAHCLAKEIAKGAILTFDFRGLSSKTVAIFHKTGLHTRIEDAQIWLEYMKAQFSPKNIVVIGKSMGAYIATHLLDRGVTDLVLIAPAAYSPELVAQKICFGSAFSEIIRRKNSWQASDAFEKIANFGGHTLIIQHQNDEKVPDAIVQKYFNSAGKNCSTSIPREPRHGIQKTLAEVTLKHLPIEGHNTSFAPLPGGKLDGSDTAILNKSSPQRITLEAVKDWLLPRLAT